MTIQTIAKSLLSILLTAAVGGCTATPTEAPSDASQSSVTVQAVEEIAEQSAAQDAAETPETAPQAEKPLIALDPGHQAWEVDMSATEPNAPGSTVMKAKASTGTEGRYSGVPEYALNLDIALALRDVLEEKGYQVLLTREDNQTAISNAERAQLANNAGADVSIRIHANGSEDSSAHGALALIPSPDNAYVGAQSAESRRLAECLLQSYCAATGFADRGIQENDTMTGMNWSTIPVVILEMGFMTNESDDLQMADEAFRQTMVRGIAEGIDAYYETT